MFFGKQSQFLWEEARSYLFIACFLLQKNLWARALELGSGIWTVMCFYVLYPHLRNWAGGGGGCSGFRSSWRGNNCLMSRGEGDQGLRTPSGFVTDRVCVPMGTRWEEAASSPGHSCSELSLNNGCLGTRWEMLASCPLGEQPTCWGQSEICVPGRASLEWGFCATELGEGREWVWLKNQTITITISLLTYTKKCMCCSALSIIFGDFK